jgi:hypothetical protein
MWMAATSARPTWLVHLLWVVRASVSWPGVGVHSLGPFPVRLHSLWCVVGGGRWFWRVRGVRHRCVDVGVRHRGRWWPAFRPRPHPSTRGGDRGGVWWVSTRIEVGWGCQQRPRLPVMGGQRGDELAWGLVYSPRPSSVLRQSLCLVIGAGGRLGVRGMMWRSHCAPLSHGRRWAFQPFSSRSLGDGVLLNWSVVSEHGRRGRWGTYLGSS